ncbi:hypothetical protein QC590_03920 [Pseudomonas putida]|uniref:hypothetical protein n=1 Tax=Pseudomonas putida TaxID=303 RepID=UPI00336403CD
MWFEEYRDQPCARSLIAVVSFVPDICTIAEVLKLGGALAVVPLPLGIFEVEGMRIPKRPEDMPAEPEPTSEPVDLTVAFLKFQINGQPAVELQNLSPGEVHDLEIEVRVSRWPVEQSELCLTPISVEPKSTYDFPTFSFDKPVGLPPYVLRQRGRAIVILPQGMHARPFEFKYMAEFLPARREQPVAVVGHRTLLIEGIEASKFQVCGYPVLDKKLFELRDLLRRRSAVPQGETADALTLLAPLCNIAGRAVQDAEFSGDWSEAIFQEYLRKELRRNPIIGAELDEHATAAGGITDLSLRGLPIELKVSRGYIESIKSCERFYAQTASYAVAKGKCTGILCVLDSSLKKTSAQSLDNLLGVHHHLESGVTICVLVIQGNLAKPSALSRG